MNRRPLLLSWLVMAACAAVVVLIAANTGRDKASKNQIEGAGVLEEQGAYEEYVNLDLESASAKMQKATSVEVYWHSAESNAGWMGSFLFRVEGKEAQSIAKHLRLVKGVKNLFGTGHFPACNCVSRAFSGWVIRLSNGEDWVGTLLTSNFIIYYTSVYGINPSVRTRANLGGAEQKVTMECECFSARGSRRMRASFRGAFEARKQKFASGPYE